MAEEEGDGKGGGGRLLCEALAEGEPRQAPKVVRGGLGVLGLSWPLCLKPVSVENLQLAKGEFTGGKWQLRSDGKSDSDPSKFPQPPPLENFTQEGRRCPVFEGPRLSFRWAIK